MQLTSIAVSLATISIFAMSTSETFGAVKHLDQKNYILYVGAYGKGINAYRFNATDGQLQPIGMVGEIVNPSFLATDPEFRYLYAVSELEGDAHGQVKGFAINRETGSLKALNSVPSAGLAPCHLAVDKNSKMLIVANYTSGGVSAFPIGHDGRLGQMSALMTAKGHSQNAARQEGPHAHEVVISSDNRLVYVPDLGLDQIRVYRLDPANATLAPSDPPFAKQDPGMGPRHIAFTPDEKYAYVMNELKSEVSIYKHDKATGSLTKINDVSSLPSGYSGENNPAEIVVDSAGKFVYSTNRGADSIAVFAIDAQTGTLKQIQVISSEGKVPRGLEIDPTGHFIFAGNQDSHNFAVFHIDASSGRLTPTGRVIDSPSPVSFTFVPVK